MAVPRCTANWRGIQCNVFHGHRGFHRNGMSEWDDRCASGHSLNAYGKCNKKGCPDGHTIAENLASERL